jgi:hypothetical protein
MRHSHKWHTASFYRFRNLVIFVMQSSPATNWRTAAQLTIPSIAYVPLLVVAWHFIGLPIDDHWVRLATLALFPAVEVASLGSFYAGQSYSEISAAAAAIAWSSIIAYLLYRIAHLLIAPDFDWRSFWGGMFIGFIPGAVLGWWIWVDVYELMDLPNTVIIAGLLFGTALGIRMGSCWSKARFE